MKILVCGDKWDINLVEDDKFEHYYGEMLSGVTQVSKKKIDISHDGFSFETIAHELCHAYWFYTFTGAADLSPENMEEVWCELFSIKGVEIIKTAKKIYQILKKELT